MILSLRARLTLAIAGVAGALAVILVGLLYTAVSALFWRDFDREVDELAQIFASLIEWDSETGFEIEGDEALARSLVTGPSRVHVEVRTPTGPLLSDPALAGAGNDMSPGTPFDLLAGDGRALRGVRLVVPPRETDGGRPPAGDLEIVVARESDGVRATLAAIARWCWLLAAGTVLVAAAVAGIAAHQGMRPVRRLARALDGISGPDDALTLAVTDVPAELRVIVREVSALLARLQAAFVRERRFTADVSHELRTPLTLMRTSIDVALQGEREPDDLRRRLQDLQTGAARIGAMVDSLLMLTRATAGQISVRRVALPLFAIVEECWLPFVSAARARGLTFINDLPLDATAVADDTTLRMIVTNLLSNAAEYTETGGTIRASADPATGVLLAVHDSGPPIPAAHLARLFEPLWRADPARSDAGVHCGIGLSLAQALARCQDLDVQVTNRAGGVVATVEVRSPQH